MTKTLKTKKGFTLTELIIVIAIIGILAAVLVPSLSGYIAKSRKSAVEQEAKAISIIYEAWLIDPEEGFVAEGKVIANGDEAKNDFKQYYESIGNTELPEGLTITWHETDKIPIGFTYVKGNFTATYSNGGTLDVDENTPEQQEE